VELFLQVFSAEKGPDGKRRVQKPLSGKIQKRIGKKADAIAHPVTVAEEIGRTQRSSERKTGTSLGFSMETKMEGKKSEEFLASGGARVKGHIWKA